MFFERIKKIRKVLQMNIGLIDVDGHNYPNYALMKISAYHKAKGDSVEWYTPFQHYDIVYMAKVFTFTPDYGQVISNADEIIKGGTGYDIKSRLPKEIENTTSIDYFIYPQFNFSIEFMSRGCIRHCPFCLVHDKEGMITPVKPTELNPNGLWIEVLDNNFFANPNWREAAKWLYETGQKINLHGVDARLIDKEQADCINSMRLKQGIHIAWDNPEIDMEKELTELVGWIKPYKMTCYVLIGFNSTRQQDLHRLRVLRKLGITPFVQPYRDFNNLRVPTNYEKDMTRWADKQWTFKVCDFMDYEPRKGFKCKEYFNNQ